MKAYSQIGESTGSGRTEKTETEEAAGRTLHQEASAIGKQRSNSTPASMVLAGLPPERINSVNGLTAIYRFTPEKKLGGEPGVMLAKMIKLMLIERTQITSRALAEITDIKMPQV